MNAATVERQVAGVRRTVQFDAVLIIATAMLICLGIVFVASASAALAERATGNPFHYAERQVVYALIGLVAAAIAMSTPLSWWRRLGPALLLGALGLLTLVLVPGFGHEVNGSVRWLVIGPVRVIQASEPARLLMLMFIADYLARRETEVRATFSGFTKPLALVGAAVLLLATVLGMLFIAGARLRDFALLLVAAVGAMAALALASPYRVQRLTGFLDPWADPYDSGFQLTQALIAIGRGEWSGVGL